MRFAIAAFVLAYSMGQAVTAGEPSSKTKPAGTAWALATWRCDALMAATRTDTALRFALTVGKPGQAFKWSIRSEDGTSRGAGKIVGLSGTREEIRLDDPYGSPLPAQSLQCVTVTTDETAQQSFARFKLCKSGAVVLWTPVHESADDTPSDDLAAVAKCR